MAAGGSQDVAPPFRQEVRKHCGSNTPKIEGPETDSVGGGLNVGLRAGDNVAPMSLVWVPR